MTKYLMTPEAELAAEQAGTPLLKGEPIGSRTMNCKEFQKLPIDEQRRILADEAKEFAERQLPADWEVKLEAYRDAEVSHLTDCLEETIDELLCGNRLYAELTDRNMDSITLLDSAQGTINRLRMERSIALEACANGVIRLQAAEQARLEAVRELEQCKEAWEVQYQSASSTLTLLVSASSRLTKAEASLRKATELWASKDIDGDREVACLDFGPAQKLAEILGVDAFLAEQVQKKVAALQPEKRTTNPCHAYASDDGGYPLRECTLSSGHDGAHRYGELVDASGKPVQEKGE